jgi:hypothetical protein
VQIVRLKIKCEEKSVQSRCSVTEKEFNLVTRVIFVNNFCVDPFKKEYLLVCPPSCGHCKVSIVI